MNKPARQKLRFTLIVVSFLLFPVTIFYMSPFGSLLGTRAGILTGSLLFFTVLFLTAVFLGRAFCGWVCPGSGLTDICMKANNKPINRKTRWIRYILWLPWIAALLSFILVNRGFSEFSPTYKMDSPISILNKDGIVVYYAFVGLILVLSLTVGRHSFCHHVCWMAPFMIAGTYVADWLRIPALHIKTDPERCSNCSLCNRVCPMSIDVARSATLKSHIASKDCSLCGECIDSCPKKALTYSFEAKSKKYLSRNTGG